MLTLLVCAPYFGFRTYRKFFQSLMWRNTCVTWMLAVRWLWLNLPGTYISRLFESPPSPTWCLCVLGLISPHFFLLPLCCVYPCWLWVLYYISSSSKAQDFVGLSSKSTCAKHLLLHFGLVLESVALGSEYHQSFYFIPHLSFSSSFSEITSNFLSLSYIEQAVWSLTFFKYNLYPKTIFIIYNIAG